MPEVEAKALVMTPTKSAGVAAMLAALFGPLGMLYSTVWGAVIMFVISLLVGFVTLGFGLLLTWPICVVWAALAAKSFNKKLLSGQRQY